MSTTVASHGRPSSRTWPWLPAAIVTAAAAIVYANTFHAPFVFDAVPQIVENPAVRHVGPPWGWLLHDRRPIAYLTFALNYAAGGFDVRGYHAVNLAIHVTAALLLLGFVRRTLVLPRWEGRYEDAAQRIALAVAVLWVIHPLGTQSVTYIVQRIEALMGLFYLSVMYTFVRAVSIGGSRWWFAVSVGACALGMATKEVTATAPLLVLWYDRAFVAKSWSELWSRRKGYYLALFSTLCVLAYLMVSKWSTYRGNAGAVAGLTPIDYALSQPGVVLHYLKLCFWPSDQCLDYWWPVARSTGEIVPPLSIMLGLLAATVWCAWRHPAWGFLGGWFFLILAPTSSVVAIRDLAFEHRMYLPLAAVVTLFVVGGFELLERIASRPLRLAVERAWWFAVLPLLVVALGGVTILRNESYRSEASVWRDVLAKAPHNPRAYYNMGRALHNLGRREEAVEYYRRAIRIDPDFLQLSAVYSDLGIAFQESGDFKTAMAYYRRALSRNPENAKAHSNLGTALIQIGRVEEAIEHFQQAAALEPHLAEFRVNLAKGLHASGRLEEAIVHYERALEIDASDRRAQDGLQSARAEMQSQQP